MAFHVACPITCRRICNCKLGFPPELRTEKAQAEFLEAAARVEAIFNNRSLIYGKSETVEVLVPKVVVMPPPAMASQPIGSPDVVVVDGDVAEELSVQSKRFVMQKKAAAASVVAEDYARRFESGDVAVDLTKDDGDEQSLSNAKVMCRLCFSGENEESERARKMISCKNCNKKYHKSCVKSWAQNRDLFHLSSWTCPSCRSCEVCRRTGDPNKLMFCKRCDGAYHCYCQQPPHKNVSSGPYLCPKHTKCHSCASTVPGNGLSVRWFLGYTCCDACGRLFVKGNYCPVCLKVYRDSESTPMVCCDICQRWVHCHCDGISDEKYLQFQVDNNLQYRCATCRGECYQVRDLEDAVQELWRRRDKADRELIARLRAAAGLPTQEEIFSVQPYSDDEDNKPVTKNEHGRSLKFSLKAPVDRSPKKKSASKKSGSDYVNHGYKEKELKPLLRLKFKNPYSENVTTWSPSGVDDRSLVKGQRSKRKRPSPVMENRSVSVREDEGASHSYDDDEIMDANWIIQKLGKDAIGKKVEVHQRSNNTWHKGSVIEVFEGTSVVSVTYDDGKASNVDLGKEGIRFYSQKRKR
ncbi:putative [histone H3]-lysine(4) N-trimethyltransferase chromatin regulator PHD family [Helianthus annuus]|nr:putative [histone H3]-lysine(4) N-trimethyltransferase chromatin regulator PHD family [Helianthus annuus]